MDTVKYILEHLQKIKTTIIPQDIRMQVDAELGPEFLLFKRVSIKVQNSIDEIICNQTLTKSIYAAECTCTACDETFHTGYISGGIIQMHQGDDGMFYTELEASINTYGCGWIVELAEGDTVTCPFCLSNLVVKRGSSVKNGRRYAVRFQKVENLGEFTAVITYEAQRRLDDFGAYRKTIPVEALVIVGKRLMPFLCDKEGLWKYSKGFKDGLQRIYHDCDSWSCRKISGVVSKEMPNLAGKSGEKTGLQEFISAGGRNPCVYLNTWKEVHAIENLMKTHFGAIIADFFNYRISTNIDYHCYPTSNLKEIPWINWDYAKPHMMLGISKEDFKKSAKWKFDYDWMKIFCDFKEEGYSFSFEYFYSNAKLFGLYHFKEILKNPKGYPRVSPEILVNYFSKQSLKPDHGYELLRDYWNMLGENFTQEIQYPQNLQMAHDQLSEQIARSKTGALDKKFAEVYEKYKELEWSDGDLCIRLPHEEYDLINEGKVLDHCVARYATKHAEGKDIILFVRHYRRPERSYYTLNVEFEDYVGPREKQLHGYGNEQHGPCKRDRHKIPHKVRAFVDQWKKDVLMPWHIQQVRKEQANKKKSA